MTILPKQGTLVYPSDLKDEENGKLDPALLTDCGIDNWYNVPPARQFKMHHIASRCMHVLVADALIAGFQVRATGTYRSYDEQVYLFKSRYTTTVLPGRPTKLWNGVTWYQLPNTAMAAVPGTSNHGWGLAVDFAEERDQDPQVEAVSSEFVNWLIRNARAYGFWAETDSEPWHWRYGSGDQIPDVVLRFENPQTFPPPVGQKGDQVKRFIRFDGFTNVWYFDSGTVCAVSQQLMDSLLAEDPNIEKLFIKPDHPQSRNAYLHFSGMTLNDLVGGGPSDHF